jgi:hypothetical protein
MILSRDGVIVPVELSEDFASGEVDEAFSDPSFTRQTTIANTATTSSISLPVRPARVGRELGAAVYRLRHRGTLVRDTSCDLSLLFVHSVDRVLKEYSLKRRM